jgi:osmotically-inducible protein OsmY
VGKEQLRRFLLAALVAVLAACADGPRAAGSLNVATYGGVVELSGFADSEQQATQAAQAAKRVQGVPSVKNAIRIKSLS